jgi:hypothetical protein
LHLSTKVLKKGRSQIKLIKLDKAAFPVSMNVKLHVTICTGFQLKMNKKVKAKLSLCLTKCHTMKTYWGSGGIAPRILDLGTRW